MAEQTLPTVRYHPTEPPRMIETAADLAALTPEWINHPYSAEDTLQWEAAQAAAASTAPQGDAAPPPTRSRRER